MLFKPTLLAVLVLSLLVRPCTSVTELGEWQHNGRATFYGLDGYSIHYGSCGIGYQYKHCDTGWSVVAFSDQAPQYPDSCGTCWEVKCRPSTFYDGFNQELDRLVDCINPEQSIVVQAVDTCPCVYPNNAASNSRWCCGDHAMTHMDLSIWAFEKLARTEVGVIGVSYRQVPCNYKPYYIAPKPANPSPGDGYPMPPFQKCRNKRPEYGVQSLQSVLGVGVQHTDNGFPQCVDE